MLQLKALNPNAPEIPRPSNPEPELPVMPPKKVPNPKDNPIAAIIENNPIDARKSVH